MECLGDDGVDLRRHRERRGRALHRRRPRRSRVPPMLPMGFLKKQFGRCWALAKQLQSCALYFGKPAASWLRW